MSDDEFIEQCNNTNTVKEALQTIVDNEDLLGYDPYYKDLRQAMLDMAERVLSSES